MKQWYRKSIQTIFQEENLSLEGLTTEQAIVIRNEKGENILQEAKKKSSLQVFLEQFKDMLVVILIIAAVISMFSAHIESTIVIISVIILNAILGTIQHIKADKS